MMACSTAPALPDRNYARLGDARSFMVEDGGDIPTVLDDAGKALVEAEFEESHPRAGY